MKPRPGTRWLMANRSLIPLSLTILTLLIALIAFTFLFPGRHPTPSAPPYPSTPLPRPALTPSPHPLSPAPQLLRSPTPPPPRPSAPPLPSPSTPLPLRTPTPQPPGTQNTPPPPTPNPQSAIRNPQSPIRTLLWLQDYPAAETAIRQALADAAPDQRPHLQFLLAQALLGQNRAAEAAVLLDTLLADPQARIALPPEAHLWHARALRAAGRLEHALTAYNAYLPLTATRYPLTAYVYRQIALTHRDLGNHPAAIAAYQQAIALADPADRLTWTLELAAYYIDLGQHTEAITLYTALLTNPQYPIPNTQYPIPNTQLARIHLLRGQAYLRANDPDRAYADLYTVLQLTTHTDRGRQPARVVKAAIPNAYQALILLLDAGQPVDDYTRGVIDVEARAYQPALTPLIRYLDTVTPHHGDAHAYLARALAALGRTDAAVRQWQTLIDTHPDCPCWTDAWFQLARLHRRLGQLQRARNLLRTLARRAGIPSVTRDRALLQAADIALATRDLNTAAAEYTYLAYNAADANTRNRAALRAAVLLTPDRPDRALTLLTDALAAQPHPDWAAPLRYWLGKAHLAAGNRDQAVQTWQQLATARPRTYYAFRAAQQLESLGENVPSWSPHLLPATLPAANAPPPSSQYLIPNTQYLIPNILPPPAYSLLTQALAYHHAGLHDRAAAAFAQALAAVPNPDHLLTLGRLLQDYGYPQLGIRTAAIALNLRGLTLDQAPPEYWPLLYPTPAREYIENIARTFDIDPALLFALIRQESHFNASATSVANARGLMQLIPDTARYAARVLNLRFTGDADLYRPALNLRLGAYFLAYNLDRFADPDSPDLGLFLALAGYNAGPGNADTWRDRYGPDPDRLLELIPALETRTYLREVQRQAHIYRALLATP